MKLNILFIIAAIVLINIKVNAQQTGVNYRNTNYSSFMTNINRADSSAVVVWPNPARSEVNVYVNSLLEEQKGELMIFNNNGLPVAHKVVAYGNNKIYLGDIANGFYTIRIIRDNGLTTSTKLIVAK